MTVIGLDPGEHCGIAVVKDGRCIFAASVIGKRLDLWIERLNAIALPCSADVVWIEQPEPVIRRAAGMANHRRAFALGMRAGLLYGRFGPARMVTVSEWWAAWSPLHTFHGKSEKGGERMREARDLVTGACDWLDGERPDVAEAILIAGAAYRMQARGTRHG